MQEFLQLILNQCIDIFEFDSGENIGIENLFQGGAKFNILIPIGGKL